MKNLDMQIEHRPVDRLMPRDGNPRTHTALQVAQIAASHNLDCQIAVERAMACGMGTCQSCCIKVKKPDPKLPPLAGNEWAYRLACTDGPVFPARDLLW